MDVLHIIWYYLFLVPHLLQGILIVFMVHKRIAQRFPIFFLYTLSEIIQNIVLFIVYHAYGRSGGTYFNFYAVSSGVSTILRFGIIYETFTQLLAQYPAMQALAKNLFRWAAVLLLLGSAALAFTARGDGTAGARTVLWVLDRTVSVMQCGLVVCLFLFSSYLAVSWRSQIFGIALGLGVFSSVELGTAAVLVQFPGISKTSMDLITMATYHICVLLWMYYLLVPERVDVGTSTLPEHDLESWNQELQRLIRQ